MTTVRLRRKVPNVVRGGKALPISNNMFLMRGRTHEQGGIDIGKSAKNGLEVEDNEVMQLGKNDVRVFSAQPILNGMSPSQLVQRGADPNSVFDAQENYKKRVGINDDGSPKRTSNNKNNSSRMGGLSRSKDYGSESKPYPSVKGSDFAGGGRSYPIPTKADAIDALRLAGLHGRSDVKAKVYARYPELRHKSKAGSRRKYRNGLTKNIDDYSLNNGEYSDSMGQYDNDYNNMQNSASTALSPLTYNLSEYSSFNNDYGTQSKRTKKRNYMSQYRRMKKVQNKSPYNSGRQLASKGLESDNDDNTIIVDASPAQQFTPISVENVNSADYEKLFPRVKTTPKTVRKQIKAGKEEEKRKEGNTKEPKIKSAWADWYPYANLATNLAGSIATSALAKKEAKKMQLSPMAAPAPIVKGQTKIGIGNELTNIREQLASNLRDISANTGSSAVATRRRLAATADALAKYRDVYQNKYNREADLLNKDADRQQSVHLKNMEEANKRNKERTEEQNKKNQLLYDAKANMWKSSLSGVGDFFNSIQSITSRNNTLAAEQLKSGLNKERLAKDTKGIYRKFGGKGLGRIITH